MLNIFGYQGNANQDCFEISSYTSHSGKEKQAIYPSISNGTANLCNHYGNNHGGSCESIYLKI